MSETCLLTIYFESSTVTFGNHTFGLSQFMVLNHTSLNSTFQIVAISFLVTLLLVHFVNIWKAAVGRL